MNYNSLILLIIIPYNSNHCLPSIPQSWYTSITGYFQNETSHAPETSLSLFQQLFRSSVTFTKNSTNILVNTLYQLPQNEPNLEKIKNSFITQLLEKNQLFITTALQQTVEVDLNTLTPTLTEINLAINHIQQTVGSLEKVTIKNQILNLTALIDTTKNDIYTLQKAGIASITSALTMHTLFGKEKDLVEKFKRINNAYPQIITTLNELDLKTMGATVQSITNDISELLEKLIILHNSTGKIGRILIEPALVAPLESLKNSIRKVGNSIEFVTTTQPIIIAAPPTTQKATFNIISTFVFHEGMDVQATIKKEISMIKEQTSALIEMKKPLSKNMHHLIALTTHIASNLQESFIQEIKRNPSYAIPHAPYILLEILERHIEKIKIVIQEVLTLSIDSMERISHLLFVSSSLCDYTGRFMGATKEHPFFNPQIIKGMKYLAEDILDIGDAINKTNQAITHYNFRALTPDELLFLKRGKQDHILN